jgi:hypothetical protein
VRAKGGTQAEVRVRLFVFVPGQMIPTVWGLDSFDSTIKRDLPDP